MAEPHLPCPTLVRLLFRYEPDTGRFFWNHRQPWMHRGKRDCARWNAKYAGKETMIHVAGKGAAEGGGYYSTTLWGRGIRAHRIALCIHLGRWPTWVDHINGNPRDNRLCNLREASLYENRWNTRETRGATSQYKGVRKRPWNRWEAAIMAYGKRTYLGQFKTEIDAALAYDQAARRLHGEFAVLNLP